LDDGVVGVVIVGKTVVEFASVVEDLDGKVEILLASDHGDEALGVEPLGPGLDRRRDGVGLGNSLVGIDGGERTETDGGEHEVAVVRLATT
jgi:hypothetical protein